MLDQSAFKTATPFSIVIFGASGNLAQLKLYPALYVLLLKKRLPEDFAIVGFARTDLDDASFRVLVEASVRADLPEVNERVLTAMLERTVYHRGQYDDVQDYKTLADRLKKLEGSWTDPVRLAYLSVPPNVFPEVLKKLCEGGVHVPIADQPSRFRCIVEKPVGHDLKSFERVREQLIECFQEDEIYLLDHWLGKEAVRNVYYLRFANPLLERLFKNTLIHHVEITAWETVGLEGRAGYFEAAGTFRDMFQSHMLMVMSLLTMRLQTDDAFRPSRLSALGQIYLPPATDLDQIVVQGQYSAGTANKEQVPGYLQEEGIAADSTTNTFAAMKLMTRTSRWEGVPFYLRSGKRLAKKETRISLQFQEPHPVGKGSSPNRLDIILQGEAGMRVYLQTKLGGTEPTFRPLILEDPLVCVGDCLPEHGLLLLEAIHGRQQWFLTFEEVRTAWRLLDPVQVHLDRPGTTLATYAAGSEGPTAAVDWIKRDGTDWLG